MRLMRKSEEGTGGGGRRREKFKDNLWEEDLGGGMRLKFVCFFCFVFTLVEGSGSGTGATETGN